MNSSPYQCSLARQLRDLALEAGFCSFGIAAARPLTPDEMQPWHTFIAQGRHAHMDYLARYADIRRNPSLLLSPGTTARSIIALAVSYYTPIVEEVSNLRPSTPQPPADILTWARYSLGDDYHTVIRKRLAPLKALLEQHGNQARICVDTAPLLEKFWAQQAGIGRIGLNTLLITPRAGSYVLLGFIITDAWLPPSPQLDHDPCTGCRRCIAACPGHALTPAGLDARRCRSYLTIEHRGPLPPDLHLGTRIYGCDICQEQCPANARPIPCSWPEFTPRPEILSLAPADIDSLTPERFSAIFRNSPIKRAKLDGLRRNLQKISIPSAKKST